eukprot:CAMPEP_0118721080 /NCGR_PEP_ID=MMETSP0800-20121206/30513_1 /TAXON_ID=210618 ORGANISM="Striatella unipunctata, Strain CCMP2910" /NCGR_SAMPLE_ID=MMETSP0800 /ASSEMBLY_ACC=CAM_ASM_000638 /LENGTH=271 /DNA_ID=CAMNT_0006628883 /DNA_START=58 /DNA_END=871 /DNA_ORIENTATION=-
MAPPMNREGKHNDIQQAESLFDWFEISNVLTNHNISVEDLLSKVTNLVTDSGTCARFVMTTNEIYHSDNWPNRQTYTIISSIQIQYEGTELGYFEICSLKDEQGQSNNNASTITNLEKLAQLIGRVIHQKREQQKLEFFFQQSDQIFCHLENKLFKKVNQAFASKLGWSPWTSRRAVLMKQDPNGKQDPHAKQKEGAEEAQTNKQTRERASLELRFRNKNESYTWIRWSSSDDGRLWIGRDLSLEKETDELKGDHRRLKESFNIAKLGQWE